jgi:DNA polymerase-3 subunit delta'
MSFREIVGHDRAIGFLRRSIAAGRSGASLIFHGPEGVGRRLTALSLAQALNCAGEPGEGCGACRTCLRIARVESGTVQEGDHKGDACEFTAHPDVHIIVPGKNEIRIDEVRSLRNQAHRRPFEGHRSVFIVDPAERLTPAAANAILKTLEEPPPTTCIILIAGDPAALLPTVRSRCRLVPFHPLSPEAVREALMAKGGWEAPDARIVSTLTNGRIGRAMAFDLDGYRTRRQEVLGVLGRLSRPQPRAHILKDAEVLGSKGDASAMEDALEILEGILRDAMLLQAGGRASSLANVDVEPPLRALAQGMGEALPGCLQRIGRARSDLRWNVNRQLLAEVLLLDLAVAGGPAGT